MNGKTGDIQERLSRLLLDLHRIAQTHSYAEFQESFLLRLKQDLAFERAWWGLASGLTVQTDFKFRLPPDYLAHWQDLRDNDPIALEAGAWPGRTVCFNAPRLETHKELYETLVAYEIRHVLCTQIVDPRLGWNVFLSLYRAQTPFAEAERQLLQSVMPHLVYAQRQFWQNQLDRAIFDEMTGGRLVASALVDSRGFILDGQDVFPALLAMEWPRWRGPLLPEALLAAAQAGKDFRSLRLHASFRRVSGLILVRLVEPGPVARLTRRELSVASAYAEGRTHKDIASDLSLSPSTVRHYIRGIFTKLNVSNKGELARVMFFPLD